MIKNCFLELQNLKPSDDEWMRIKQWAVEGRDPVAELWMLRRLPKTLIENSTDEKAGACEV